MKKFVTMLLAFTFIVTAVIVTPTGKRQKANALYMDGETGYFQGISCIYYFSDSPATSSYKEFFERLGTVVYDPHPYITIQELQYMLYSGYFWGFTSPCMVVLELKAMKPSFALIENFVKCFREQDCGVILITPYLSEFNAMDGVSYVLGTAYDEYALFLQDTILAILSDNDDNYLYSQVKNRTTIFMDGRIAELDGIPTSYDILDICMYQKGFARLLNYMYYGLTVEYDEYDNMSETYFDEANFMKPLFRELWDEFMYSSTYFAPDDLNYFSNEQIDLDDYIELWADRLSVGMGSYHWDYKKDYLYDNDYASDEHYSSYNQSYQDFYQGIINSLFNRNIHIMAHVGGTTYIDLLNWTNLNLDEPFTYTFTSNYLSFGNLFQIGTMYSLDYVYGMGIWSLKPQFYSFLKDVQDNWEDVKDTYNILNDFPIYIYEKDPIIWGDDGLIIQSNSQMREYCSNLGFYDYGDGAVIDDPSVLDDLEMIIREFFARL